jgi:hypothetical protein
MAVHVSFEGFKRLWKYLLHFELTNRKTFKATKKNLSVQQTLNILYCRKQALLNASTKNSMSHFYHLRITANKSDASSWVDLCATESAEFSSEMEISITNFPHEKAIN